MRERRLVVVFVLLLTGACSSGGGLGDVADDGERPETAAPTAGGPAAAESLELPDGIPTDVPAGGVVRVVVEPAPGTFQEHHEVRVLYPADEFASIVDFYDDWFADEGIDVQAVRGDSSVRWRWTIDVDGAPRTQDVLVTVGGTFDEGGSMLRIAYDRT